MANTALIQLESVYKYYLASPDGITYRTLNEIEDLATDFLKGIRRIQAFADEKQMILAADGLSPTPRLVAKADSIIDSSVRKKRPSAETFFANLFALGDDNSSLPGNAYDIVCTGKGGVCCDWGKSSDLLKRLISTRPVADAIVQGAKKIGVQVPSPANSAFVTYGDGKTIEAQGYRVFTDWIYRSPVDPENGAHFIPPQSVKIIEGELEGFTMGLPIDDWRSDHTPVWGRVTKLKNAMPQDLAIAGISLGRMGSRLSSFNPGDIFPYKP